MPRAADIRLLEIGLNAIVFPASRPRAWWEKLLRLRTPTDWRYLCPVSATDRLARYHDAALFHPLYSDERLLALREQRGWNYLKAWRDGWFPKINLPRRKAPVTSITQSRRAASARG